MKPNGLKLLTTLIGSYILMISLSQAQQSIPTSSRHLDQELAQKQNQNQLSDVIDDDLAKQEELNQGMPNAHPSTHEGSSSIPEHIDMDDDDDDDDDVPDNEDSLGSAPSV